MPFCSACVCASELRGEFSPGAPAWEAIDAPSQSTSLKIRTALLPCRCPRLGMVHHASRCALRWKDSEAEPQDDTLLDGRGPAKVLLLPAVNFAATRVACPLTCQPSWLGVDSLALAPMSFVVSERWLTRAHRGFFLQLGSKGGEARSKANNAKRIEARSRCSRTTSGQQAQQQGSTRRASVAAGIRSGVWRTSSLRHPMQRVWVAILGAPHPRVAR